MIYKTILFIKEQGFDCFVHDHQQDIHPSMSKTWNILFVLKISASDTVIIHSPQHHITHYTLYSHIQFNMTSDILDMDWDEFQLRTIFPNTKPGTPHDGVNLSCFYCGESVVQGDDIHCIKGGAIWTKFIPDRIKRGSKRMYNKYKECYIYAANCKGCSRSVGTVYMDPYKDADKPFPCVKVTYMYEGRNSSISNSTALDIMSADDVKSVVDNLTESEDQEGRTATGVKLNARNYSTGYST